MKALLRVLVGAVAVLALGGGAVGCGDDSSEQGAADAGVAPSDAAAPSVPQVWPGFPRPCSDLFAENLLPTFEVEIAPAEWTALQDEFVNWLPRRLAGLPAKPYHRLDMFRYGNEVVLDAAIRLRGNENHWDGELGKMQFQISFNEFRKARFHGLRKIVLDSSVHNVSFLRDRLALAFMRDVGVPASCANNARLVVNGEYYGLYTNMEKVDKEMLQRSFIEPDGNLYKQGVELQTNLEIGDTSRLDQFWSVAGDMSSLAGVLDIEAALTEWAAEALIPQASGYWSGGKNYYLYDDPKRGFLFIPWDLDAAWETLPFNTDPYTWHKVLAFVGRPHFDTITSDPTWFPRYLDAVDHALASYSPDILRDRVNRWAVQIDEAVEEDPHKQFTVEVHRAGIEKLRRYVEQRAAFVSGWLACWRSGSGGCSVMP